MKKFTRRETLVLAGAAAAITFAPIAFAPGIALAAKKTAKDLLEEFTGGKPVTEGKVELEMPEIAENGNTVPLFFSVDSPMTTADHVKRVIVIAEGNPRPQVATFNFSVKSGKAEASSRMRLAKTQNVWAVAEMSDGTFSMAKAEVKVTIGGCGG